MAPSMMAGFAAPGLQLLTYFAPGSSFSFASNIWNGMAPTTSSPSTPLPTLLPPMNSARLGRVLFRSLAATNLVRARQFLQLRVEHLERHGADHQSAIPAVADALAHDECRRAVGGGQIGRGAWWG